MSLRVPYRVDGVVEGPEPGDGRTAMAGAVLVSDPRLLVGIESFFWPNYVLRIVVVAPNELRRGLEYSDAIEVIIKALTVFICGKSLQGVELGEDGSPFSIKLKGG
jgi:hypothetical protein